MKKQKYKGINFLEATDSRESKCKTDMTTSVSLSHCTFLSLMNQTLGLWTLELNPEYISRNHGLAGISVIFFYIGPEVNSGSNYVPIVSHCLTGS
jgi:hypothetical protein